MFIRSQYDGKVINLDFVTYFRADESKGDYDDDKTYFIYVWVSCNQREETIFMSHSEEERDKALDYILNCINYGAKLILLDSDSIAETSRVF